MNMGVEGVKSIVRANLGYEAEDRDGWRDRLVRVFLGHIPARIEDRTGRLEETVGDINRTRWWDTAIGVLGVGGMFAVIDLVGTEYGYYGLGAIMGTGLAGVVAVGKAFGESWSLDHARKLLGLRQCLEDTISDRQGDLRDLGFGPTAAHLTAAAMEMTFQELGIQRTFNGRDDYLQEVIKEKIRMLVRYVSSKKIDVAGLSFNEMGGKMMEYLQAQGPADQDSSSNLIESERIIVEEKDAIGKALRANMTRLTDLFPETAEIKRWDENGLDTDGVYEWWRRVNGTSELGSRLKSLSSNMMSACASESWGDAVAVMVRELSAGNIGNENLIARARRLLRPISINVEECTKFGYIISENGAERIEEILKTENV